MARFFIDRPIFAWVLAILVMMAGVLALLKLPVAQFPPLAPPSVAITVTSGILQKSLQPLRWQFSTNPA